MGGEGFGPSCRREREACSAGVSPAVAGASRSRAQEVLASPLEKESIETEAEAQEVEGRTHAR
jgi:hypothetical protein